MAGYGNALADMIVGGNSSSPQEYETYTVRAGDSLSSIAGRMLGDPMRWKEIWNINPGIANPDSISVGQVINIPAGAIASGTDPAKTSLPGPRMTAVAPMDQGEYASDEESSLLSSPWLLVGAAGVAFVIILMATAKKA